MSLEEGDFSVGLTQDEIQEASAWMAMVKAGMAKKPRIITSASITVHVTGSWMHMTDAPPIVVSLRPMHNVQGIK